MEFKDYYAVLGVPKTATSDEIKRAYKKLARSYHPDLNPGDKAAETKFKELNEANEVLGDPEKRKKYDELGSNWRAYENQPPRGPAGGWPGGGGGGASYRTVTPEEMEQLFGGSGGGFSDFFQTFFGGADFQTGGGGPRARSARPRRGADVEAHTDLTLEEAFRGTTRRAMVPRDGKEHAVEVRIPAGIKDGARVRATGEGAGAPAGGTAGDLYLSVHVLPHSRFERKGQDLHLRFGLPVTTAVLGGEIEIPTLAGTTLRLKIPELTPAGRVFRLRGHGMPAVGSSDDRGDLYATAEIQVPATVSADERSYYEALRTLARQNGREGA